MAATESSPASPRDSRPDGAPDSAPDAARDATARNGKSADDAAPNPGTTRRASGAELHDKQIFTTGEAAEVCKVSQQTIIRCFDAGRLNGFRVPGSRFRRIPRDELIRFMKDNNIPAENLGGAHAAKRILVVDDDPNIVDLVVEVLGRDPRLKIRTASTGYDAGMMSATFKPDLIVLDYMLPDINGNIVCESIRANPDLNDTRIILVSGVVNQAEINDLLEAGADEFLKKPYNLERLLERVRTLLELPVA